MFCSHMVILSEREKVLGGCELLGNLLLWLAAHESQWSQIDKASDELLVARYLLWSIIHQPHCS